MATHFKTTTPDALLSKFKTAVEQTEILGKITTWKPSEDRKYFTHTSKQWEYAAWLQPVVEHNQLTFYIVKSKSKVVSKYAYGFYHGHIIETMLNHFDSDFSSADATSFPIPGDICQ